MLPARRADRTIRAGFTLGVSSATIDSLLKEKERYPPSAAFRKASRIPDDSRYAEAAKDPEAFWARMAGDLT